MLTFDHQRQIRYLIAGWPGSVHDTKVWESGSVKKNPNHHFSPGQYQLGDSFTLSKQMLVPYRQPAASILENQQFNLRISRARVVSEHGNGILKGRWQSLRGLPICINKPSDIKFACQWITAGCVLHNMINKERLAADDDDGDSIDLERNASPARSVPLSVSHWRQEFQRKVAEFWS
uniref:DDE Tnp4 domain-containing protein n=1 Tax=Spongospora subterranea TaxID=70186 RepID=A0A0H5RRL8_9EUKA|eukprot:CRZ11359.1 hypothetical protein [Spongospora subterranea]